MKNSFFLLVGLAFIAGCIYLFLQKPALAKYQGLTLVGIGDTAITVETADTNEERQTGLSGRESLAEASGMLFIFEKSDKHGFWMKDMQFSIDIAWIDKDKKIVWIEKAVSPETFPKVFYPPSDALYVLEVQAGTFDKNHVDIGEEVLISALSPRTFQ